MATTISYLFLCMMVLSVYAQYDFTASLSMTAPGMTGTMTGTIYYSYSTNQIRTTFNSFGGSGTTDQYHDYKLGINYMVCSTCTASSVSDAIPRYFYESSSDKKGSTSGQCTQYSKPSASNDNDVAIISVNGNTPCSAQTVSGAVYTFSNVVMGKPTVSVVAPTTCPPAICQSPVDLMMVLDDSGSISDSEYVQLQQFTKNFVATFQISPTSVNIGFVQFGLAGCERVSLPLSSNSANVNAAAGSMNHINTRRANCRDATCIGCGLQMGMDQLNQYGRPGAEKVIVLITDGENNQNENQFPSIVNAAHQMSTVFGVLVGTDADPDTIQYVSSSPDDAFVVTSGWTAVNKIIQTLSSHSCQYSNPCGTSCQGFCSCNKACICPSSCDDNNYCTTDTCTPGVQGSGCTHTPNTCNDNNACTNDACDPVKQCLHTNVTCDDSNACTIDSCNTVSGCSHQSITCGLGNTDQCKIYSPCNPSSATTANPCPYDVKNCTSTDPCIENLPCDPVLGCVQKRKPCIVNGNSQTDPCFGRCTPTSCTSDSQCTSVNPCLVGTCKTDGNCTFAPKVCNDNSKCTIDSCDTTTGQCNFANITCTDGNACTKDTCDAALGCQYPTITCNDNNACTTDTCNVTIGCVYTPINVSYACNDFSNCTIDTCDVTLGCVHTQIKCPNSDICTASTCDDLLGCVNTTTDCKPSDNCHLGQCSVSAGGCQNVAFDNSTFVCGGCTASGCGGGLTTAQKVGIALGAAAIAGIVIGAVAALAIFGIGGKVAYDYLKVKEHKISGTNSNPLYEENANSGSNPMYTNRNA